MCYGYPLAFWANFGNIKFFIFHILPRTPCRLNMITWLTNFHRYSNSMTTKASVYPSWWFCLSPLAELHWFLSQKHKCPSEGRDSSMHTDVFRNFISSLSEHVLCISNLPLSVFLVHFTQYSLQRLSSSSGRVLLNGSLQKWSSVTVIHS